MMNSDFEKFCVVVLRDEDLQERLRSIRDRVAFVAEIVNLGARLGYDFSRAEVEKEMQAARRVWNEG